MNKFQEVAHYRSAFSQANNTFRMELVRRLRDIAIEQLTPTLAKIPRPMSDDARECYRTKGISTEWNLRVADEAIVFFLVTKDAEVSASTKYAAQLLSHCTHVLEEPSRFPQMENWILDAYAGIETDNIEYGLKHRTKQKARAKKPRGKLDASGITMQEVIRKLSVRLEYQTLLAKELWPHLHAALDNLGLSPVEAQNEKLPENPSFKYETASEKMRAISFKQFANSVSKFRKKAIIP